MPHALRCAAAIAVLLLASCHAGEPADEPLQASAEAQGTQSRSGESNERRRTRAGPGRWIERPPAETTSDRDPAQREMIARLEAIGYVSGSRPPTGSRGVSVHRDGRIEPGLNLYTSGHGPEAILMDAHGRELHRWTHPFRAIWPGWERAAAIQTSTYWRRAYLLQNGDLLAIFEGLGLIKLDRDSNLIWALANRAHHDLDIDGGRIYVLTRKAHVVPAVNPAQSILEDSITILDLDGTELDRISLVDAFLGSAFESLWRETGRISGDIFHTNSVKVLKGTPDGLPTAFRDGNLLLSLLHLHAVAILDPEARRIVWTRTGDFRYQHDARLLANGNLLVFDNQGREGSSAVLEIEPGAGGVVWSYRGDEASPFYSHQCGISARLPNTNTLIVESEAGRAFEVDANGEIVWEFRSPHRAGEREQYVATLFDLTRLPPAFPMDWLDRP